MKKLLAIALLATTANVATADQDIGCGLGSMVMAGQSGPVFKVLGATTNGTSGNQTFGITTGTLGCQSSGAVTSRARLGMFTGSNLDRLARDMSVGQGETLNVLADLMGVKNADKDHFFQATRTNFGKIFAPENETAGAILAALEEVMANDNVLATYTKA
ncbi:MAG: DUF3015 family protein [Moraxellaceae bacterium]|nr:DUF3015 family protein [Moraxellaceae bacterium]MBP7230043.1 DUF3015 family protein [Moraxellaceae bacterium]MBP9045178.1 DUF3015 family protein [Moraxellaceae bacterium]MCC6199789.1 DUF3015 family protein [Moraxellaceae bacterium]HQV42379.1 DUF3015 family protein [Moraxellaceae bacterium]